MSYRSRNPDWGKTILLGLTECVNLVLLSTLKVIKDTTRVLPKLVSTTTMRNRTGMKPYY